MLFVISYASVHVIYFLVSCFFYPFDSFQVIFQDFFQVAKHRTKVIIDKSRDEVSLLEQDTIEN